VTFRPASLQQIAAAEFRRQWTQLEVEVHSGNHDAEQTGCECFQWRELTGAVCCTVDVILGRFDERSQHVPRTLLLLLLRWF